MHHSGGIFGSIIIILSTIIHNLTRAPFCLLGRGDFFVHPGEIMYNKMTRKNLHKAVIEIARVNRRTCHSTSDETYERIVARTLGPLLLRHSLRKRKGARHCLRRRLWLAYDR